MALVNHNQVVVAPIQQGEVDAIAHALFTTQVSMEQYIVTKPVLGQRVVLVVALVGVPVVVEFLGTEHQHGLVAILVILDDRDGCECLT